MKRCPNCGKQYPDDANFCPVDAGRLEPDAGDTHRGHAPVSVESTTPGAGAPAIGGRFELVAAIGGHHTGAIYQATDRETGRPCAVKLVDPSVFPNALLLQRAERELKQLERVDLPEVARVIGHGRQGEQLWIAMELVAGAELARVVLEAGAMPAAGACALIRRVAHGLAEAAKQGVIHRDLAAKNVLVCDDGESVKIINFPIAVPFSDRVQGVPEFLSPEQVEGKPADQRSSIYSLGALLYFALTGQPPFTGEPAEVHKAHLSKEPVRVSQRVEVPDAVDALVMKALEKASAKRFMTLHQMIGELDTILTGAAASPAVQSKAKIPLGPAQTLVGVAAFQVGPGPVSGAMPIPTPIAPLGPSSAPIAVEPAAPRPVMASGELGRRAVSESRPQTAPPPVAPAAPVAAAIAAVPVATPVAAVPEAAPAESVSKPAAVIVPTPAPQPAIKQKRAATSGGRGKAKVSQPAADTKGKFRETMWFKKGELDEAAAAAAASATSNDLVHDKADALPIEDRYRDDGTLDRRDAERLSLRTGGTNMMNQIRAEPLARKGVSEEELLGELRRSRGWVVLFIVAVLAALAGGIYYLAS